MHLKQRKGNMSIRKQYIIKFLAVMLLPMIAVEAGFYAVHLNTVKRDTADMIYYRIEQAQTTLDLDLKQVMQIALKTKRDRGLYSSTLEENVFLQTQMRDTLIIHNVTNRLCDNMQIYYQAFDGVFSTEGFTKADIYFLKCLNLNEKESDRFLQILKNPSGVTSFHKFFINNKESMIYVMPIEYTREESFTTVFFIFYADAIRNVLSECLTTNQGEKMAVVDADGGFVFSDFECVANVNEQNNARIREPREIVMNDIQYSLFSCTSSWNGWQFIYAIPANKLISGVKQQQIVLLQIAVMVLVSGCFMAIFLAQSSYRPISNVLFQVGGQKNHVGNELENILLAVTTTRENYAQLQQIVERNTPFLVDYALEKFLNGLIDAKACQIQLREINISMEMPYFMVAAISVNKDSEKNAISEVHQCVFQSVIDMNAENINELNTLTLERSYENVILLIFNTINEWDGSEHLDTLMKKFTNANIDKHISIGVGRVYNAFDDVVKSYTDAMIAVERMRSCHEYGIMTYDDTIAEEQPGVMSDIVEKRLQLVQIIRQGNGRSAMVALEEIEKSIGDSYLYARYILVDIINAVVHLAYEVSGKKFEADVERVLQVRGIHQTVQDLSVLVNNLCEHMAQQRLNSNKLLSEKMLKYVNENFSCPELSLDMMAEHFGLSSYYISRFFGQCIGVPFREYITNLRIAYAKSLLIETDLPIRDIVNAVGYADTPTFNKRFKKYVGVTPGNFRSGKKEEAGGEDK